MRNCGRNIAALISVGALLSLQACGGAPTASTGANASAPATSANIAPTITAPASVNIVEGRNTVVTVQIGDPDGTTPFLVLSGADASHFKLNGNQVQAISLLDFESPADANGDNTYNIIVTADDGQAQTPASIAITVTNIPLDGIARISGSRSPSPVGDLTGDGIDDLLVASAAPANVPVGAVDLGYILFRNETIGEMPITKDLQFLATAPGAFRGAKQLRATGSANPKFMRGFMAGPTSGMIEYAGIVSSELIPTSPQLFDATILFPDQFSSAFSGPFFIDLSNDPHPPGVRSTRSQVNFLSQFMRPAGDFNGDGTSDAILQDLFDFVASGDPAIEFTLPIIDGSLIRAMPSGLFAGVVDLSTQAVTLTFPTARYVEPSFVVFEFEEYAEPGSADVTGDGVDDFIRLVGLRGSLPVNPPPVSPEGHEIVVLSGSAISARPKGLNDVESFTATEHLRILIPEAFGTSRVAGLGDVNGDGFAEILITTVQSGAANPGGSQFGAYLVSGKALVQAPSGTVSLTDFPGAFGTAIKFSDTNGFDVASIATDWIGGANRDIIVTDTVRIAGTSPILYSANAVIIADTLFTIGFPPRLDLSDPNTNSLTDGLAALPAGSFARIASPRRDGIAAGVQATTFLAAAAIGDGDGDGFRDLAITDKKATLGVATDPSTLTVEFITYVIPSGRLRAAAASGDSIDLDIEFP